MIDVERLLEEHGIEHNPRSKRAGRGWIQLPCPFDDCSASSDYMGIHRTSGMFHCWLCARKGHITYLLTKILGISYRRSREIVKQYSDETIPPNENESQTHAESIDVQGLLQVLPEPHRQYLIGRRFDPDELVRKYGIGACGMYGRFPFRITIPVFDDGLLVNMTARDITGQQEPRYLSLSNTEAIVPIKSCVYNIDNCRGGNILIVEGPFDVWRIGGATVSFFGTAFKSDQVMRVLGLSPERVFVLFDSDAAKQAEKLANMLAPFAKVEVLGIPVKDPAELSPELALEIRQELGI